MSTPLNIKLNINFQLRKMTNFGPKREKEFLGLRNFQKLMGKVGLNAEAKEIEKMEKIPLDIYKTKKQDGFIWIGITQTD